MPRKKKGSVSMSAAAAPRDYLHPLVYANVVTHLTFAQRFHEYTQNSRVQTLSSIPTRSDLLSKLWNDRKYVPSEFTIVLIDGQEHTFNTWPKLVKHCVDSETKSDTCKEIRLRSPLLTLTTSSMRITKMHEIKMHFSIFLNESPDDKLNVVCDFKAAEGMVQYILTHGARRIINVSSSFTKLTKFTKRPTASPAWHETTAGLYWLVKYFGVREIGLVGSVDDLSAASTVSARERDAALLTSLAARVVTLLTRTRHRNGADDFGEVHRKYFLIRNGYLEGFLPINGDRKLVLGSYVMEVARRRAREFRVDTPSRTRTPSLGGCGCAK